MLICIIILVCFNQAFNKEFIIYQNNEQILDSFPQFGIILGANITYQSITDQPCQIISQKLISRKENEIVLIPQFSETSFNAMYDDGKLNGQIDEIVANVLINEGAIVLTSGGVLIYLKQIEKAYKVDQNITISIDKLQFRKPVFLEILQKYDELLILLNEQTLKIKLNYNNISIFGQITKIYDVFLTEEIKSMTVVEDLLFLAQGDKGLHVYSVEQRAFQQISCTIDFQNVTDFRVFMENAIYYIFALDYEKGIKVITYNTKTTLFYENKQLSNIPYKGEIIDLNNEVLMIVSEQENESLVYELKISYYNNNWKLVKTHKAQKNIQDIEITDYYAVIIGQNGHEIIFHSLPTQNEQLLDKIIIPGVQKIHFLSKKEANNSSISIIGITKHTFFTAQLAFISQYINCAYSETDDIIEFTYFQNSTKCPVGEFINKICYYSQNYTIQFIHPVLTTAQSIYVYILTFSIIFIFILILGCLFKEFRKYSYFVHSQIPKEYHHQPSASQGATQDIFALNSFDSPMKSNKPGSYVPPPLNLNNEFKIE